MYIANFPYIHARKYFIKLTSYMLECTVHRKVIYIHTKMYIMNLQTHKLECTPEINVFLKWFLKIILQKFKKYINLIILFYVVIKLLSYSPYWINIAIIIWVYLEQKIHYISLFEKYLFNTSIVRYIQY